MFSAYTIRKVLPRLLIAAIAIQLSWSLCLLAINVNNSVAHGIEGLLYAPFGGQNSLTLENIVTANGGSAAGFSGGLFAAVAAGSVGIFFSGGGSVVAILALAGTAALGVLVAIFTLVLRRVVMIALVLTAPIAIVAWVLPGTERLWKLWWDSFLKLLIMYPLILLLIAGGRIFAYTAANVGANQFLGFIMIVLGFFGPLFLIPATLKMAGTAFTAISGAVNNRNKGLFDRLRNTRQQAAEHAKERRLSGNTFRNGTETNWRGKFNRGVQGAGLIGKAGFNPRYARTNLRTAVRDASEAEVAKFMQESASFNAWSGDDAKVSAARFDTHDQIAAELARFDKSRFAGSDNSARREEAVAQIMRTKREVDNAVLQKARVRAQAKTGTGYQDPVTGEFNAAAMLDDINAAYGDDRNGAGRALAEMRSSLANSGQIAGLAGFGTWAEQLDKLYKAPPQNHDAVAKVAHEAIMDNTLASVTPSQALYGKPSGAAELAKAHARRIKKLAAQVAAGQASMGDFSTAVAHAAGVADAMGAASPQNGDAFVNNLFGEEFQLPGAPGQAPITATVRQFIDNQMGGDPEFAMRRSTFAANTTQSAQAQAAAAAAASAAGGANPGLPGGGTPGGGVPGQGP